MTSDAAVDQLWGAITDAAFDWFWCVLAVDEFNRAKAGEVPTMY